MGYTHYWSQTSDCPPIVWAQIARDVQVLLNNPPAAINGYPIVLADGHGQAGTRPAVTGDYIAFNGAAPWDYETFRLERRVDPSSGTFCKTARKPYDLVVCAALLVAHTHAPKVYGVTSDGGYEEWAPAIRWYTQVFKRLPALPAAIRPQLASV